VNIVNKLKQQQYCDVDLQIIFIIKKADFVNISKGEDAQTNKPILKTYRAYMSTELFIR